jgi:uncharacterized protein YcaQ
VQIDYVNVLVAAHYQIPFSKLGPSRIEAASLLSPFDPVVWYRDSRLFWF